MKNVKSKLVLCFLAVFAYAFIAGCSNPIVEKWWESPTDTTRNPGDQIVDGGGGGGGSGANFGAVVFDADGGIPTPKALHISWGGTVGRLRPVLNGTQGFVGWFDENDHLWDVETRPVKPEDDIDGDGFITLKARWQTISHTVSFVTTPSTVSVPSQLIATGAKIVPPVNPNGLGDGRGFAGWWERDGTFDDWGRQWDFATDTVKGPVTLYAKWEYQTRTVILEPNGGTRPDGSEFRRTVLTIPISFGVVQDPGPIVKEGYTFVGWFTGPGAQWNFATDRITEPDVVPGENPFRIYAEWEQKVYIVSFSVRSAAASQPDAQEVRHGENAARPTVTNPGMILIGWFTDWERTTEWNFASDKVVASMTLYAMWESATPPGGGTGSGSGGGSGANFGVVRFDGAGGVPNPQNLDIEWGSVIGRLRPMEKGTDGFAGWFDEKGEPWNTETRAIAKEDDVNGDGFISLTAKWTPVSHTVRFVTGRSQTVIPNQSVATGGYVVEPVKPASPGDGTGFAGWWNADGTDGNWGRQWDFANNVVTGAVTLYAKWESRARTVILVPNGGTRPNGTELTRTHFTINVDYGVVQDPGPLVRTGHAFGGWFTDIGFNHRWNFSTDRVTVPEAVPGENPLYLYAKWVQNIYIVSFAVRSATATPQPDVQQIPHGMRVERPIVTNPGMVLSGWFTDWNLTTEWDFFRGVVASNMILYANWEPEPTGGGNGGLNFGVVSFNLGGGQPELENLNIAWNSVIGRLPSVEKPGNGFVGWLDENGRQWDLALRPLTSSDDVNGDGVVTLTASWTPIFYTVNFVATPSPSVIPNQFIASGSAVVKPAPPLSSDGRSFAGWFTMDGSVSDIWGEQWNFANRITGNLTLYAKWSGYEARTVILEPNGGIRPDGSALPDTEFSIPIVYGIIQDPGPLIKTGYTFGGWFTDTGFANQWDFAKDRVTESDGPGMAPFYLYAKWVKNVYTIMFDVRDSAIANPAPQKAEHGSLVKRPVITNPGKILVDWYTNFERTNVWNFSVDVATSNMVLYAKWEAMITTLPPDVIIEHVRIVRVDFIDFAGNSITYNQKESVPPGGTNLTPSQLEGNTQTVAEVARILRANPTFRLQLAGHANPITQDIDTELAELEAISRSRAGSVLRELVDRQGIPEARLINVGFNPWNLNISNDPDRASLNRCVELVVLEVLDS